MQLKQKYTIYNITYENELFISDESTNVNIKDIMQHFFNSVQPVFNNSCSCHFERSEESDTNSVKNNEAEEELKPDSEKSKSDSEDNAKASIYNYISKLKKERNDSVDYEILEIKAMTLEEYNNKKSE